MINVLLVEDNDVFREALELMLGVTPDIDVVGAVADGTSAVERCAELQPDVVLMDYRLPGLDGVEATAAVRATCKRGRRRAHGDCGPHRARRAPGSRGRRVPHEGQRSR